MRKIKWHLWSLFMVMVLLLNSFPISVQAADEVWVEISDVNGLKSIRNNLSGNYRLIADIDIAGAEWDSIGPFSGKLDANSKVIRNFVINNTITSDKGLFSSISTTGQISNLGIENANITAGSNAGILAGVNSGAINCCYVKGTITGSEYVGGLVGRNFGTIINSFARASVSGKDYLGGLAGANSGTMQNSYAASPLLPSVFNNYLEFNGTPVGNYSAPNTGGYIDIPHKDIYVGDKFTLEAWFQWDGAGTKDVNFIMGKGYEQFEIHTGGSNINGIRFIPIWNENGDSWIDIKNVIRPGWFHVAAVYEYDITTHQASAQVYINGEAQDLWQGTVNLGKIATLSRLTNTLGYEKVNGIYVQKQSNINIGRRTDGWFYFDGKICNVRFWNITRNGEDIKRDKDKVLTGNESGLVGYWKLNEESGDDAIDSSITHNNGKLVGNVVRTRETAATHKGGLVGHNTGTVLDSYYDGEVSEQSDFTGASKTTSDMKLQSTFTNWNFSNMWGIDFENNDGYPYLLPIITISEINSATVVMDVPEAGAFPQTADQVEAKTGNADYTVSNVVWKEELTENNKFKAGQIYTACVTLTSKNGKMFPVEAVTPVVIGATVSTTITIGTGIGNAITFDVAYASTAAKTVAGIQMKKQPVDLIYTEGENLELAGIKATLIYNDSSTLDVNEVDFDANNITASPANGTALTVENHNGKPIILTCNSYTASTNNLTVSPMAPPGVPTIQSLIEGDALVTITWGEVPQTVKYNVYSSISQGSYTTPTATVAGEVYSCDVTGMINGTAYYFVVTAVGPGGESAYSNEVSATLRVIPGAPTNVTATSGNGQATVSFTPPVDNGGTAITRYIVTSSPDNITATGTDTTITVTGLSNGTIYTFTVTAVNAVGSSFASSASNEVNPYNPSKREPSEKNTPSKPKAPAKPSTKPVNTNIGILVNGESSTAAIANTTREGDKTVTTVHVDDEKVAEKLTQEGDNAIVTIPVLSDVDIVIGQLNGQTIKNMEKRQAVLEIKTGLVTYTVPASQISIDNVSEQIGKQVELKDITINIKISEPTTETIKIIEDAANKNNYQIAVKPIAFEITCSSGDKLVEVSKFNTYVERLIMIPDGIDPSKITTGIVLNNDGSFSHVPTVITVIDGKYYAKISSLTNSVYSIISNPRTFADVESHWAKGEVNDMASRLVIGEVNDGLFSPDKDVTRAEFTSIVINALGLMRRGIGKDSFNDVRKDDWCYDAISIAYEYGIISGYDNGRFGPEDTITREQAMIIITRAMKITKLMISLEAEEGEQLLVAFSDARQDSTWAKASIASCIKAGIVSGRNGKLIAPKNNITRAEVAAIIRRLLEKSGLI